MTYRYVKRLLDVLISLFVLVLLVPVFTIIAIVIKSSSPGPTMYRGERAARGHGTFRIYKFRTMVADAESKGGYSTAADDPRFTSVGRFLRRFKLDELPQFINVIMGDMSLVGPRPQVTFYTKKYVGDEKNILSVRPGITDLASIYFVDMDRTLGSGDVDMKYQTEIEPLKNKLRVKYVKEMSLKLDVLILLETAFRIFRLKHVIILDFRVE